MKIFKNYNLGTFNQERLTDFIKELLSFGSSYTWRTITTSATMKFKSIDKEKLQKEIFEWLSIREEYRK